MNVEECKRRAAEAALEYLGDSRVIGIGTGTTVGHFLDVITPLKSRFDGAVSSSEATTVLLKEIGIPVLELNTTGQLDLYVDGADQSDEHLRLIKGAGGALTREKILAAASRRFVCIVDQRKLVDHFAGISVPVEVIPMARSFVARQLVKMNGRPGLRESFVTDNGNVILETGGLRFTDPLKLEEQITAIPGVVSVGIFARRPADVLLIGGENKVETLKR